MGFSSEQLDEIFQYHTRPEDVPKYRAIRAKARDLAQVIVEQAPEGADQTAAIRKLREAVMTANAAIALERRA